MEYVCFIGVLLWVVRSCNISLCALKMCGSLVVKKCNWHANSTVIFQLVELIADCWVGWTVLLSLGGLLECLIFLVHITIRLASTDDDRFIHICFFLKSYTHLFYYHYKTFNIKVWPLLSMTQCHQIKGNQIIKISSVHLHVQVFLEKQVGTA